MFRTCNSKALAVGPCLLLKRFLRLKMTCDLDSFHMNFDRLRHPVAIYCPRDHDIRLCLLYLRQFIDSSMFFGYSVRYIVTQSSVFGFFLIKFRWISSRRPVDHDLNITGPRFTKSISNSVASTPLLLFDCHSLLPNHRLP